MGNDYIEAFAYYKNYFDRITSHFDAMINNKNKLDINNFYKESPLKKFYDNKYDDVIYNAHIIRNSNPISHASAELIDDKENKLHIEKIQSELSNIIQAQIKIINESTS